MNKIIGGLAVVILLVGSVVGFYMMQETPPPEQPVQPIKAPPAPVAPVEPVKPQVMQENVEPPLPELKDSDALMHERMAELVGADTFKKYFRPGELIRHIVVTIDNLPRKTAAVRLLPTKPVEGKFLTRGDTSGDDISGGEDENLVISPKNAARYQPYVRMAEMVDARKLVAVYASVAPLFQRAYQELGYPNGSFNDRLITVIDHLLDTPQVKEPVRLIQPNVMFQYANPTWEAQSAGRKILMRMGRENAAKIKEKLRAIRSELSSQFSKQLSAR